jgi:hypothetical protein
MSMADAPDRFTALPDDQTLAASVVALEEHGFSVEVVQAATSPPTPGAPPTSSSSPGRTS